MRATYIDAFANAVWALMVAYLTFVANLWAHIGYKLLLAWGSALAVQMMILAIQFLTSDRYTMVLYMQTHLIPVVADEVKRTNIWQWEKFVSNRRGNKPLLWEWPPSFVAFASPAMALGWRGFSQWSFIDYAAVVVAGGLAFISIRNTLEIIRTRKEWERSFNATN
ncbi:MAG TPA: hypothetical protein VI685_28425 [Candidatus Angelobacter sp.]